MHAAGMRPQYLDCASVPEAALQRERQLLAEQAAGSGKSEAVIAKVGHWLDNDRMLSAKSCYASQHMPCTLEVLCLDCDTHTHAYVLRSRLISVAGWAHHCLTTVCDLSLCANR